MSDLPKNVSVKCILCGSKYITSDPVVQLYCVKCIDNKDNLLQPNN